MSSDSRVKILYARWVEQAIEAGTAPAAEDFCRNEPELLEPLRERIRIYRELEPNKPPPGVRPEAGASAAIHRRAPPLARTNC